MKYNNLIIEKKEYMLLKRLMNLSEFYKDRTLAYSMKKLMGELEHAQIVDDLKMPKDVIRFNTKITIDSENGWQSTFTLVTPNESDVKNSKISILTPMGSAVIGYAKGDTIIWEFPSGEQKLTIKEVEQKHRHVNIDSVL